MYFHIKNPEDIKNEKDRTKNNMHLTNLGFADDLFIIAKSKAELTNMMTILKEETAKVGLEMHAQKTKVLINGLSESGGNYMEVKQMFRERINAAKEITKDGNTQRQAYERICTQRVEKWNPMPRYYRVYTKRISTTIKLHWKNLGGPKQKRRQKRYRQIKQKEEPVKKSVDDVIILKDGTKI